MSEGIKFNLDVIPYGIYCYSYKDGKKVNCPYWSKYPDKPEQENGYCAYLGMGDWEIEGLGLLWDQVKECRVREGLLEEIITERALEIKNKPIIWNSEEYNRLNELACKALLTQNQKLTQKEEDELIEKLAQDLAKFTD